MSHRLRREGPPEWVFLSALTTMVRQAVNRLLNLGSAHFIQMDGPQLTDEVPSQVGIPFERLRRTAPTCVLVKPMREVVRKPRSRPFCDVLSLTDLLGF